MAEILVERRNPTPPRRSRPLHPFVSELTFQRLEAAASAAGLHVDQLAARILDETLEKAAAESGYAAPI